MRVVGISISNTVEYWSHRTDYRDTVIAGPRVTTELQDTLLDVSTIIYTLFILKEVLEKSPGSDKVSLQREEIQAAARAEAACVSLCDSQRPPGHSLTEQNRFTLTSN